MGHMRQELPARLAHGKARVLKQYRGNGGIGVWKVQSGAEHCYRRAAAA
jgi:glutathione synthase/RimK-type ligase-like ATP-grasp enzyme